MGIDEIISEIKNTKWEEKSRSEIDTYRRRVAALKMAPAATSPIGPMVLNMVLKEILRDQLIGKAGHAKDQIAIRMFNHYLDGGGAKFTLSVSEMRLMAAGKKGVGPVDLRKKTWTKPDINPKWTKQLSAARKSGKPAKYSGSLLWGFDNGAIANYTVNYDGAITAAKGKEQWAGYVDYYDRFDLDPRWSWSPGNPQGRSRGGERRTRIGYILNLGTDYDVTSEKAKAVQQIKNNVVSLDGNVKPQSTDGALDISG